MKTPDEDTLKDIFIGSSFGPYKIIDVQSAYHPHPYTIGSAHVAWASDHWVGLLHDVSIRDGEKHGRLHCQHPGCTLSWDQHLVTRVLIIDADEFDKSSWMATVEVLKTLGDAWPELGIGFTSEFFQILQDNGVIQ